MAKKTEIYSLSVLEARVWNQGIGKASPARGSRGNAIPYLSQLLVVADFRSCDHSTSFFASISTSSSLFLFCLSQISLCFSIIGFMPHLDNPEWSPHFKITNFIILANTIYIYGPLGGRGEDRLANLPRTLPTIGPHRGRPARPHTCTNSCPGSLIFQIK